MAPRDIPPTDSSPTNTILALARQAMRDFGLIEPGDRVAVGMSGGKDSALLYATLRELQRAEFDFELVAVHLDQRQPGFDRDGFDAQMAWLDATLEVVEEDTHSVVQAQLQPGQIPCSICGRLRRGILNRWAAEHGFTKLALGHHLDDALETFLLNLLYGRRLDPLKPATPSREGAVTTIRPLVLVEERKIEAWVVARQAPTVACPVCDTYPDSRRRDLKHLLSGLSELGADPRASVRAALYESERGRRLLDDALF